MDDEVNDVLGVEQGRVRLREFSDQWALLYEAEAAAIQAAAGAGIIEIRHYGSTAIPRIKAKPILDILAGVHRLDDAFGFIEPLAAIGYEFVPAAGVAGHHIFGKGSPRTHLLHFVEYDGPDWRQSVLFHKRMTEDPHLAKEYEMLKVRLAQQYSDNRAAYTAAKGGFIESITSGD